MDDFEAFVRARSRGLLRAAYLLTGERQAAEDLLQEALTRLAKAWHRVSREGNPEAYARQALYTLAIDSWRRRSRRPRVVGRPHEGHPEARHDDRTAHTETRMVLQEALARLTPKQRAVVVLRFFEDRTEVQTALVLGCSVSTVKSQTRDALARLRADVPGVLEAFPERVGPQ